MTLRVQQASARRHLPARSRRARLRGVITGRGLALTLDFPAEPVFVDGDATRLGQVVGNVAVSGYAQPEDLERAAEAGFDHHVAKPPDPDLIERLLG